MPETMAAAPELPSCPNATSSGFILPSYAGPLELGISILPTESAAPTTNTFFAILKLPVGLRSLKLTLAWTDQPAQANAAKALVNDLDMELLHVSSGQTWQPWILSRFPHKDSLLLPAVRGRDTVNNVEQITLDAPPAGNYIISIKGNRIVNTVQSYFLAYGADTANRFEWMYPMPADPVIAGATVMARWHSTFSAGTTGQLQYSLPNGVWQTVSNNVDLGTGYVRFNTPDTFSTALLRMVIGGNEYKTDSFVLSKLIGTQVGFNCPDSFFNGQIIKLFKPCSS